MSLRHDGVLMLAAAGAWLAAAVVTGVTARHVAFVVATASVSVAVSVGLRQRLVASLGIGLALGAAAAGWHVAALHHGPVPQAASHTGRATLTMTLTRDPLARASPHGSYWLMDATVDAVDGRGARAPVLVIAHGAWAGLLPGQRVSVRALLQPPRPADSVAAVVLVRGPPTLVGRPPWWQRAAGAVRAQLRRACAGLPSDERGLLPGLVLGDVSAMPPSLTDAFRVSGLTHLNAVSGENCAIVLGAVLFGVRRTRLRRGVRLAVAAAALVSFVVLARPSPSVQRAAVMGGAALVAVAVGRRPRPVALLSLSVFVLVLVDPFLARQVGFALSVLATAAIVLLAPAWTRRLSRRLPRPVAAAIAVPAAAQLACTPVLVAAFGQLTPWAVPANLLAAPAVAPATLLGIAAAVVALVSLPAATLLAWLGAVPAAWLAGVARFVAALPGAGLTGPRGARGAVAVVVAVVCAVALHRRHQRVRAMLGGWPL